MGVDDEQNGSMGGENFTREKKKKKRQLEGKK